jgi:dihydrofolate reductase
MGHSTYKSIGRSLPERKNIILSRQGVEIPGCVVVGSIDEALKEAGDGEVMVIGGQQIYEAFLPMSDRIYLSIFSSSYGGDARFPDLPGEGWNATYRCFGEGNHPGEKLMFSVLEKNGSPSWKEDGRLNSFFNSWRRESESVR